MHGQNTDTERDRCESLSVEIVRAVATETGEDPAALAPLYEYIDPDALESLFAPTNGTDRRGGTIEFTYDGHQVSVTFGEQCSITVTGTDAQPSCEADSASVDTGSASSRETAD